jgi:DHA1 family inner membrane transport protein
MAYFRNNTVNLLNLHYAIRSLALTGGGAFFAIFLLKSGVPAPAVLAALAAILVGRFVIRPSVLVLARRVGLKPLVIAGTLVTGAQYLLLAEVHSVSLVLILLCVVSAVGETCYWTSYHAYFAILGDAEHRGHQVGVRDAIAAGVGIIGPVATGWALTVLGPRVAFGCNALVLGLSALPILWTPNVKIAWNAPGVFRAAIPGVLMFAADGWMAVGSLFVWSIALFISLGESFSAYGGAMALMAGLGAVSGLVLGRWIDAGHGIRATAIGLAVVAVTIALRATSYGDAPLAVLANAIGALVGCLYGPALGTALYNQAKHSPCALRFHIATEGGWDIGGAAGTLIAAALLWLGAPLGVCLLLPLLAVPASFALLRRHYDPPGARFP